MRRNIKIATVVTTMIIVAATAMSVPATNVAPAPIEETAKELLYGGCFTCNMTCGGLEAGSLSVPPGCSGNECETGTNCVVTVWFGPPIIKVDEAPFEDGCDVVGGECSATKALVSLELCAPGTMGEECTPGETRDNVTSWVCQCVGDECISDGARVDLEIVCEDGCLPPS